MNFAGGVLHWSAAEFWTCPLPYFRAAYDGWALANGVRKAAAPEMTESRLKDLFAKGDAMDAKIRETADGA